MARRGDGRYYVDQLVQRLVAAWMKPRSPDLLAAAGRARVRLERYVEELESTHSPSTLRAVTSEVTHNVRDPLAEQAVHELVAGAAMQLCSPRVISGLRSAAQELATSRGDLTEEVSALRALASELDDTRALLTAVREG